METKEQLRDKLRQIEVKEFKDLIDKHYPEFKALEGKCFKVENCYSCPKTKNDYWFMYVKIQKIGKEDLYKLDDDICADFYGWSFQTDSREKIDINFRCHDRIPFDFKEYEITNEEFKRAWLKLQSKISNKSDV